MAVVTLLVVLSLALRVPAHQKKNEISYLNQLQLIDRDTRAADDDYSNNGNDVDGNDADSQTCIRKVSQDADEEENESDWEDNGTDERLTLRGSPTQWRGQKVKYRVLNTPVCSEISDATVKQLIDAAAEAWNSVPLANVLLVNIEAEESNEVSDEVADIELSFQPCLHPKGRDGLEEGSFSSCTTTYAHALTYKGDRYIHFNTLVTWTDENYDDSNVQRGDLIKPNLYSIALHEFGHSLGLSHADLETQVMYGNFGGDRKYETLELGQDDMAKLQTLYPVEASCADKYPQYCTAEACNEPNKRETCAKTCGDCEECGEDLRDDYLKCTQEICSDNGHQMRIYCKKTCGICAELCTGPPSLPDLTTSGEFPVLYGTVVTVGCGSGFQLSGSSEVTCLWELDYSYQTQPQCDPVPETDPPCVDKKSNCVKKLAKKKNNCNQKKMQRQCQMTCGLCNR